MSAELLNKLKHNPDDITLIINRPEGVTFGDLHFDSGIGHDKYDFILFFAERKADLDIHIPTFVKVAKPDATFWVGYPKKSGKIKSNITRDKGWGVLNAIGFRVVAQVAINEDWSALRIKPVNQVNASKSAKTQTFEATITTSQDSNGAWVEIPFNTEEVFGKKGQVKVKARFDGHPYQGSIANMGNGPIIIIPKEIREAINKKPGDQVKVEVEKDTSERKVNIPDELRQLLDGDKDLNEFYESLSFTNQKEYADWINNAKRPETKEKRLNETRERLSQGIKNPFVR